MANKVTQPTKMPSNDFFYEDDVSEVTQLDGNCFSLYTYNFGYTYILEYIHAERRFIILGTNNPNYYPSQ